MTYHRDRPDAPQAECAKLDTRTVEELFFAHHLSLQAREAKRICQTCPLIDACREYADAHEGLEYPAGHVATGVWGGETTDQRKARRANRGTANERCPGCARPLWRSTRPTPVGYAKHKSKGACIRCVRAASTTASERAQQVADEDARWTLEQLKIAKGRYKAGDRDPWTLEGRRVYERWHKRARRRGEAWDAA